MNESKGDDKASKGLEIDQEIDDIDIDIGDKDKKEDTAEKKESTAGLLDELKKEDDSKMQVEGESSGVEVK